MQRALVLASLTVIAGQAPAFAHHSIAAIYDREKTVEVEGVLSKIELQNPHSAFELTVPERGGRTIVWAMESRGVQGMTRIGFDRGAIAVGDKVKVTGSPARNGDRSLWLTSLQTASGKRYDFSFRNRGQGFGAP
jgi:hypothetical protein